MHKKTAFTCGGRRLILAALVVGLGACSDWPPGEEWAERHFTEHSDSFDRLAEKMRGTDYWRVSRTNQEAEVRVWPDQSGEQEPFFVDDDPEWHALLSDIGVLQVAQQDGAVSMGSGSLWRNPGPLENAPDERFGFSDFTHDPNMLDRVVLCAPEHEEIPCGRCAVPLSDDWYQDHSWWPLFYDQERSDAFHDGEMDLETYSELEAEDRLRCMIDGYTEMGYDVERLFDLDPTD